MPSLEHWQAARTPEAAVLPGSRVRLERLDPARHGDDLWQALHGADADPQQWTYMGYGPYQTACLASELVKHGCMYRRLTVRARVIKPPAQAKKSPQYCQRELPPVAKIPRHLLAPKI